MRKTFIAKRNLTIDKNIRGVISTDQLNRKTLKHTKEKKATKLSYQESYLSNTQVTLSVGQL